MQTKIEGIVLSKVPFKERDLIASLLLRSGKKVSVLFPGGSGGGKYKKSSIVELGHMLKIELRRSRGEIYGAKEWQVIWEGEKIRLNHVAFFLMCFYLEVSKEVSFDENLKDDNYQFDQNSVGNFRVLSNALFFLEESIENENFSQEIHLPFFLSKLLQEQGLFPILDECIHCGANLQKYNTMQLSSVHGGFSCESCGVESRGEEIFRFLSKVAHFAYKEYGELEGISRESLEQLMNYFLYNLQLRANSFKSYQMLF